MSQLPRYDAEGPIILWIDYGCEGWKPQSFDTIKEVLETPKYGNTFRITRRTSYEIIEKEIRG